VDLNGNTRDGSEPNTSVSSTGGPCRQPTTTTTYKTSSGSQVSYTINCSSLSVSEILYGTQYVGTVNLLTSIVLEDGTQYTFAYDTGTSGNHPGSLQSITLPSGGVVSFTVVPGWPNVIFSGSPASVTFGGGTWNFSYAYNYSTGVTTTTVLSPVSDKTVFTSVPFNPYVQSAQYYSGSSTLLKTVSTTYDSSGNFFPVTVTTTLNDSGQSSSVSYQYFDLLRNYPSQIQETDFNGTVIRTTVTQYHGPGNKPSSVNVYAGSNTNGTPVSSTLYTYDEYTAHYCKNGVPMLTNITGAYGHDDNYGLSATGRGNVTTTQKLISGSSYATTHICYDTLGNVTQTVDANGNPTSFDYTDNWVDSYCIPSGTVTHAFPTTITDALGHRTKKSYFTCGVLTQSTKDENDIQAGRVGTTFTYDILNRPLVTMYPGGGQTTNCYSDDPGGSCYTSALPPFWTQSRLIAGSTSLNTKTLLDGLGRNVETQLTSDPDCTSPTGDKTDTTYDGVGHVHTVSNPYCSTGDSTYGLTSYAYDALGRTTLVTQPDGSTVTTLYSGNTTTVTDEAGKKRQSKTDALGRLTQVVEDPGGRGYVTNYAYDVLDNLTSVVQDGSRQRNFGYDSLSRLTSATNPESGTITYSYDANGNLASRTAPAPNQTGSATVTTSYTYDALNRLTSKVYNNGSPGVYYYYDQATWDGFTLTNPIGRLTSEGTYDGTCWTTASGFGYDAMGRPSFQEDYLNTAETSGCPAVWSSISANYDLAGNQTSLTYPSGRMIQNQFNGAGRTTGVTVADLSGYKYLSGANYAPFGSPTKFTLGNGVTEASTYNNRLQPLNQQVAGSASTFLNHTYGFNPGHNNGNVLSITDNLNSSLTQNFTYDSLNRLYTAQTAGTSGANCWGQQFGYDAWGNLLTETPNVSGCPTNALNVGVNAKNQITNPGFSYDPSGNLLADGTNSYTFDAENHLTFLNSGAATYTYDAEGRRMAKKIGSATTEYIHFNRDVLAEYSVGDQVWNDYIFAGSRRLVVAGTDDIFNPGFEQGTEGWRTWAANSSGSEQVVTDPTRAHSGSKYLQLSSTTAQVWTADQTIAVNPGDQLTFGGWAFLESGNAACVGWNLAVLDANGNPLNYPVAGCVTGAAWTYQSATYTVPSGAASVTLYAQIYQPTGLITARFDDAFLTGASGQGVRYYHADHLGSARLMTDSSGNPVWSATYLPFGTEWNPQATTNHYKFTGKERDSESGNDNFEARYYSSNLGRFLSTDPDNAGASSDNPQSWNAYSYVLNNPINATDPDGLDCIYVHSDASWNIVRGDCLSPNDNGIYVDGRIVGSSVAVTRDSDGNVSAISFAYNPTGTNGIILHPEQDPAISPSPSFWSGFGQMWADGVKGTYLPFRDPTSSGESNQQRITFLLGSMIGPEEEEGTLAGLTRWGWKGAAKWRALMKIVRTPGTHEALEGLVPTFEEAKELIQEAGGTIDRVEEHAPGGVSPHAYPHINYTTASGQTATLRIQRLP
jgi:RHS repeat-associated protein